MPSLAVMRAAVVVAALFVEHCHARRLALPHDVAYPVQVARPRPGAGLAPDDDPRKARGYFAKSALHFAPVSMLRIVFVVTP